MSAMPSSGLNAGAINAHAINAARAPLRIVLAGLTAGAACAGARSVDARVQRGGAAVCAGCARLEVAACVCVRAHAQMAVHTQAGHARAALTQAAQARLQAGADCSASAPYRAMFAGAAVRAGSASNLPSARRIVRPLAAGQALAQARARASCALAAHAAGRAGVRLIASGQEDARAFAFAGTRVCASGICARAAQVRAGAIAASCVRQVARACFVVSCARALGSVRNVHSTARVSARAASAGAFAWRVRSRCILAARARVRQSARARVQAQHNAQADAQARAAVCAQAQLQMCASAHGAVRPHTFAVGRAQAIRGRDGALVFALAYSLGNAAAHYVRYARAVQTGGGAVARARAWRKRFALCALHGAAISKGRGRDVFAVKNPDGLSSRRLIVTAQDRTMRA